MQADMSPSSQGGNTSADIAVPDIRRDNTGADIEVEFLLKEYEALRAEIIAKQGFQLQLTNVAVLLFGGVLAGAPLLFFSGTGPGGLRIPPAYLVAGMLVAAVLFTSLMWAVVDQDIEIGYEGHYIHKVIRARVAALMGTNEEAAAVLNWERFRNTILIPHSFWQASRYIGFVARATARYGLFFLPSLIILVAATLVYFSSFQLPPLDALGWLNVGLFLFNVVYLVAVVPFAFYVAHVYAAIAPPLPGMSFSTSQPRTRRNQGRGG